MKLEGKNILLGITGSIAAFKAVTLLRLFIKEGAEVRVILSPYATNFVTKTTLSVLSNYPVHSDFSDGNGNWNSHQCLANRKLALDSGLTQMHGGHGHDQQHHNTDNTDQAPPKSIAQPTTRQDQRNLIRHRHGVETLHPWLAFGNALLQQIRRPHKEQIERNVDASNNGNNFKCLAIITRDVVEDLPHTQVLFRTLILGLGQT